MTIFGLSDRGDIYLSSADTLVLLVATWLLLVVIGRLGTRSFLTRRRSARRVGQ